MTNQIAIKANRALSTREAVRENCRELAETVAGFEGTENALVEIVIQNQDVIVEVHRYPAMDGDFVSSTHGVVVVWMPEIGRAAVNSFQSGDWQWTDASSPEDAARRYAEDDMRP